MNRTVIVLVFTVVLAFVVVAQWASRLVDDWMAMFEALERVVVLKIPQVVVVMMLRPGNVVVDLGVGSGLFAVPLVTAVGVKGKVLVVEIDRAFFLHIQRKVQAAGVTNVQTIAGEPMDSTLLEVVDVVLFHDVLYYVENSVVYVKSFAKYLKSVVCIVIVDYLVKQGSHRDDSSLQVGKEEVAKLLVSIGFKSLDDVVFFLDKYFVIYRR